MSHTTRTPKVQVLSLGARDLQENMNLLEPNVEITCYPIEHADKDNARDKR